MTAGSTDLLDLDVPDWAEQQAGLLRRHAAGEPVAGIDWANIAGQIELIAKSEVAALRGLLTVALQHLLKAHGLPEHPTRMHWLIETETFLDQARAVFSPSMTRRVALAPIYDRARRLVLVDYPHIDPARLPQECPFSLVLLLDLSETVTTLLGRLG
jgi:hypothetical protein